MIIYTDEDVRPDLLTPKEREQFPEVLDNSDRRAILSITRPRMDNIDMDGHLMPSAEEWIVAFGTPEAEGRPEYRTVITRTVASPYTAGIAEVPAGIADTVQRLLDRGIAIDAERCESYMVTDHPGSRWINVKHRPDERMSVTPGENMYVKGSYLPFIEFPVDNARKGMNTERMAELIKKAADECGLVIEDAPSKGQTRAQLRLTLPYCLDGTSRRQALHESDAMARAQELPKDWQQRRQVFQQCADTVRLQHGGAALYSDAMIQDRFARFARSVERLIIQNPSLMQKNLPKVHHEDYLTKKQLDNIQHIFEDERSSLYNLHVRPFIYRQYTEVPEKVDEVARKAGYRDYSDFLDCQGKRNSTSDKRWSEFRRLEDQLLHPDWQGRLLLFRLSEGVRCRANATRADFTLNAAAQAERLFRLCDYPMGRLQNISFFESKEGKPEMYLEIDGKPALREVSQDEMNRLKFNATTPFEVALATCGREVGYTYRPHVFVSNRTLEAVTARWQQTGNHPLATAPGHEVYPVSEAAWKHAFLLTRFEQLPPSLADKVAPADQVYRLPPDKLEQRMDALLKDIDRSVTGMQFDGVQGDTFTINWRYKDKVYKTTVNMQDLDFYSKLPPGVTPDMRIKEMLADKAITQEREREASRGGGMGR